MQIVTFFFENSTKYFYILENFYIIKLGSDNMKNPLMSQLTERSCGATAIFNCVSFLFEREEMPTAFLKIMASYSVSCYDDLGLPTNKEFCDNILFFTSSWLHDYSKERRIPLIADYLTGSDVNLLSIRNCLSDGGCVCLKTFRQGKHFVTVTNMDNEYMYIFDPYFQQPTLNKNINNISVVNVENLTYNRKIRLGYFISTKNIELCLGPEDDREAVLFYRNNAMLEREFV